MIQSGQSRLDRVALGQALMRAAHRTLGPIMFSTTIEDHLVIEAALRPGPGDRVLCLAAAGDNPLNLLGHGPAEIVAVDLAATQVYLTRLKVAALRVLDAAEFRAFVGARPHPDRLWCYRRLVRPVLDAETRLFWDAHPRAITTGVVWSGSTQRLGALFRPLIQRAADTCTLRGRALVGNTYLEPLFLRSFPDNDGHLAPYLRECDAIRERLHRLTVRHVGLSAYLATRSPGSVDVFALSNVVDWLPGTAVSRLLDQIARVAAPGARVLIGSRRSRTGLPDRLPVPLTADADLERRLLSVDRVGYFRSMAVLSAVPGGAI